MEYTKYAAVGHFKCHRTLDGKKYPVVIVGRKEYMLDVQEMTVWSSLAWRILSRSQIAETYLKLTRGLSFTSRRTLDDCIDRLVTRGLVAEGRGSSEYAALYDLLSCLYIAPVSANPFLRLGAFLKLWIWDGAPFSKAICLFSRPKPSAEERQIVDAAVLRRLPEDVHEGKMRLHLQRRRDAVSLLFRVLSHSGHSPAEQYTQPSRRCQIFFPGATGRRFSGASD